MKAAAKPSNRTAIDEVRGFHRLGVASRGEYPKVPFGGWGKVAERLGVHPEYLSKARLFASPKDGYTKQELDELCRLAKQHPFPLTVSYIIKLLAVPKADRPALQKNAAAEGWSYSRLVAEIRSRYGRRKHGAHPVRQPSDLVEVCGFLDQTCSRWRRWYAALSAPFDQDGATLKPRMLDKLPRALRLRLGKANAVLRALENAAAEAQGKEPRHQPPRATDAVAHGRRRNP